MVASKRLLLSKLLKMTSCGLYCEQGDFFIDPWKPVKRALLTHAHADHARPGSDRYLVSQAGIHVFRKRLGEDSEISVQAFGQPINIKGVKVTFFPAGHILGSAQIKLEKGGMTVVVSGDYKRDADPTCRPFELVRCHVFVTESTFGLPVYRWPKPDRINRQISDWWKSNQTKNRPSLILAYSLGKAQRILSSIDPSIGPLYVHGAIHQMNRAYRDSGIPLPDVSHVGTDCDPQGGWGQSMIVAPPSVVGSSWARRFRNAKVAMASGWMQIRGTRRRKSFDKGFLLSDHVDWKDLMRTVKETECEEVHVTHGYSDTVTRYLNEQGLDAHVLPTSFQGEQPTGDNSESQKDDLASENESAGRLDFVSSSCENEVADE